MGPEEDQAEQQQTVDTRPKCGGLLTSIQSPNGRYALWLAILSLAVRLVPAYYIYGSFDVGAWILVQRTVHAGNNPYLTGKLNWPPLWLFILLYAQKLEDIYNLPNHFAVKIVPCAADAAIAVVLYFWFARQRVEPSRAFRRALWYALNPVAIATCAMQGQFESLPSLFTLMAILAAAQVRAGSFPRTSVIWLGLAGLAKTWPLTLAPAFLCIIHSRAKRAAFIVIAAAPAVLSVGWLYIQQPKAIRENVINYHGQPGMWGITVLNSWLPERVALGWSHFMLWILYAAWLTVYARTWRRGSVGKVACLGVLTFYVFTPGFGPQYLAWILGMGLAMDWRRARLYTVLASLSLAVMYVYSPYNGEYFDFVRHQHTGLIWASFMKPHHVHTTVVLFLPLWGFCIWWWWSMLRDVLRVVPAAQSTESAVGSEISPAIAEMEIVSG
jgi:hypothetical protein